MCVEIFEFLEFVVLFLSSVEEGSETIVGSSYSATRIDPGPDDEANVEGIDRSFDTEKIKNSLE